VYCDTHVLNAWCLMFNVGCVSILYVTKFDWDLSKLMVRGVPQKFTTLNLTVKRLLSFNPSLTLGFKLQRTAQYGAASKFTLPSKCTKDLQYTETGNISRIKGPCGAPRPVLKG
jgi:hypothetical protein